jgi:hypothetical protein
MVRNIILVVASLVVLGGLFAGYLLLVGTPTSVRGPVEPDAVPEQVPPTSQPFQVMGDTEVRGSGRIEYTQYDERTGRPIRKVSCYDMRPVPGTKDHMYVDDPELAMLLPSGMIATILADEGELKLDRIESDDLRPQSGWFAGDVRIIIDRETSPERAPRSKRPADLIQISTSRLEFDLERGELRTKQLVRVECDDFEIAGSGLDLVWSESKNRVETLTIQHGEEFVLYRTGGLFGPAARGDKESATNATDEPVAATPAKRPRSHRRVTAYECTLAGNIVAEQYGRNEQGEIQVVGGLRADQIQLLFDVGTGARRMFDPTPTTTPTSGPASRPARDPGRRLVLRWNGPLKLGPAAGAAGDERRLHFTAWGKPAVLTRGAQGRDALRESRVPRRDPSASGSTPCPAN